ncbi:thiamine pyrophosphate-dependent enzyme [Conexibacter stalactiti]|uniref:dihydrolipoyllysine-residue succinyltransferase n=1 Tax=Conexibacter stalactiti TaxID=1940611 RepID=A0ABU4HLD1_9ACTN|nr:thiamine pyrophosphate-dependent enzyme [Conexibacter stalactiti]MDW5594098.1 thiamine pyrophosphate-dependent enzyme [Conexibacter stalactiti]MEC5034740.1 thiamine pyrophosphate-dependent enzyme [Conexibacter stalactiti]
MPPIEFRAHDAYRQMAEIRAFEERCLALGSEGLIAGSVHVCAGQEAIPVGAMAALTERDRVISTYRGHGWALACGVPLDQLLGEVCQRAGGVNGGRGGSAHLTAPAHRHFGENSIVGAGVPIAAGLALAATAREEGRVVLVSVGDGAMNQGATTEGILFALARRLPLVIVCENNGWAEMTRGDALLTGSLAERVAGFGVASSEVDGCDPEAVQAAVAAAAERARSGAGPVFLECKTVRLLGHYNRDIEHYRSKADREQAAAAEPLGRLRGVLIESGTATAEQLDQIDAEALAAVDAATVAVRAMPEPDPADAATHLFAPQRPAGASDDTRAGEQPEVELTYQKAVNGALRTELATRPEVVLYGEDVGVGGGIFGVSRNLQEEFGAERVFDVLIAESAILGSAVGAAMAGLKPIVEIMWGDFLLVALDQLVNQAANVRYVSRGELTAPLVVRTQQGVTPGSCAQHSQSLEALLAHVPGLKVGLPATPQDAAAMLRAAVADPDPCILFEARSLYQTKGLVRPDAPVEAAAGARLRRDGADLAIVTWGTMVAPALEAAEQLAAQGLSAAVLDLRWLAPLDMEAIAAVVAATSGRVLVLHEANVTGGFGAEVAARIHEAHFDLLDAPVARLGAPDTRIPSAPALQRALIPDVDAIVRRCNELAGAIA